MINEKQILDEVEKTLQAYDKDIILDANPFLLTRIKSKTSLKNKKHKNIVGHKLSFNQIVVILILVINLITLIYSFESNSSKNLKNKLVNELKQEFQIEQSENNF